MLYTLAQIFKKNNPYIVNILGNSSHVAMGALLERMKVF